MGAVFNTLREPRNLAVIAKHAGIGTASVFDGARQAVAMRRAGVEHLEHLRSSVNLDLLFVPHQFGALHGLRTLTMIAQALADELGV